MEEWRDIKGYEGLYQVSNEGKVRSLDYNHTGEMQLLIPSSDKRGYRHVNLFLNGNRKMKLIHRLVAEAFIPNPNNLPCVNHKDENKENNFVFVNEDGFVDLEKSNLEWCTQGYNNVYNDRAKKAGENIRKALAGKIPKGNPPKKVYQFNIDGELIKIWDSKAECARNGFNHVSECCNGKRKQDKGYKWSYKPL